MQHECVLSTACGFTNKTLAAMNYAQHDTLVYVSPHILLYWTLLGMKSSQRFRRKKVYCKNSVLVRFHLQGWFRHNYHATSPYSLHRNKDLKALNVTNFQRLETKANKNTAMCLGRPHAQLVFFFRKSLSNPAPQGIANRLAAFATSNNVFGV